MRTGGVEVALDPSELELEPEAVAARYERHLREQRPGKAQEDLSDMLADHVARQKVMNIHHFFLIMPPQATMFYTSSGKTNHNFKLNRTR